MRWPWESDRQPESEPEPYQAPEGSVKFINFGRSLSDPSDDDPFIPTGIPVLVDLSEVADENRKPGESPFDVDFRPDRDWLGVYVDPDGHIIEPPEGQTYDEFEAWYHDMASRSALADLKTDPYIDDYYIGGFDAKGNAIYPVDDIDEAEFEAWSARTENDATEEPEEESADDQDGKWW